MKAMTKERAVNLAREVECLSKSATRCVVQAVEAERRGEIDKALLLFDKQRKAEDRIKELLAIHEVCAILDAADKETT